MQKFDINGYLKNVMCFEIRDKNKDEQMNYIVEKYYDYSKKSIENKMICCLIVFSISRKEEMWTQFMSRVGLDEVKNKSQIKKYKVIGANFGKLMNYIDVLPNRWSTVYKIANLSNEQLDELVSKNVLHPNVTASELNYHIKKSKVIMKKVKSILQEMLSFKINEKLAITEVREMIDTITDWRDREMIKFDSINAQILDMIASTHQNSTEVIEVQN